MKLAVFGVQAINPRAKLLEHLFEVVELQEIRREQQEVADLLEQLTRPPGEKMDGEDKEKGKDEKVVQEYRHRLEEEFSDDSAREETEVAATAEATA